MDDNETSEPSSAAIVTEDAASTRSVSGVVTTTPYFAKMGLSDELFSAIKACGLSEPKAVQQRVITAIFDGRNVVLDSEDGHTSVCSIAVLRKLNSDENATQAMILAASSDKVQKIRQTIEQAGGRMNVKCISCTSVEEFDDAVKDSDERPHVVVSTCQVIRLEKLSANDVKILALDEADNMLASKEQILELRRSLPEIQVVVTASKMSDELKQFASELAFTNAEFVSGSHESAENQPQTPPVKYEPDAIDMEPGETSAPQEKYAAKPSEAEIIELDLPAVKPAESSSTEEDVQVIKDRTPEPDDADVPEPFEEDEKEDKKDENPEEVNEKVKLLWEEILEDSELTTGDEMDLTKTLEPLAYFLTNQEELLNQVLSTVKGVLFSSIMPGFLKELHSDYVKRLFLRELKQMDTAEIRNILRGGDFVVTPDLLPAIPSRSVAPAEQKQSEEPVKPDPEEETEEEETVKPEPMEEDDDGFRPYPKKKEDEEVDDVLLASKAPAVGEAFFKGTDDDEKRRLEEALAELEAKEAEAANQPVGEGEEEEEEEPLDADQRKALLENEVRRSVDRLSAKLDELDNEAEKLQAEGYQDMLHADAKDASSKLEVIEKNLTETQEDISRLKSTVQAQIDAGVRMMNLNPKFVLNMKEVQELIARGRTLNRLLSPMRMDTDRALAKLVRGFDEDVDKVVGTSGTGLPRGFQPMSGFVPVVNEPQPSQEPAAAEGDEGQDGKSSLTWSARWVSSEKVQKVLTQSKVFSRMRQKMGVVRQKINIEAGDRQFGDATPSGGLGTDQQVQQQTPQAPDVFQSVDEYRKFFRSLPDGGRHEEQQQQQQQSPERHNQQQKQPPSFDTKKLVSLADQVKQAMESGGLKGLGKPQEGSLAPPPGWPPRPESYYRQPQHYNAPPSLRPPGTDGPPPGAPPPGFPPNVPPPQYHPPGPGSRPPYTDVPPPWGGPPPTIPTSSASGAPAPGLASGPPPGHPPPGMWDGMFSQPPPATPGQPLPWQQQPQQQPQSVPPQWPPTMGPGSNQLDQTQGARHWPPLRPEDYDHHQHHHHHQHQQQQQYAYPDMQYGAPPAAAALLGSPLTTSDEETESSKKKRKKHKKDKKKRKKEKKEKKKSKRRSKDAEDDEELEEGEEEEDEVMAVGEVKKPPVGAGAGAVSSQQSTVDLGDDEEGEIKDDEENLWAKIMGD